MEWILIAITLAGDGSAPRYEQIARFETKEVCAYAPEGLRTEHSGSWADMVFSSERGNPWEIRFRCIPATHQGLEDALGQEERAALFLAGKGEYAPPWWRDRLEQIKAISRD